MDPKVADLLHTLKNKLACVRSSLQRLELDFAQRGEQSESLNDAVESLNQTMDILWKVIDAIN